MKKLLIFTILSSLLLAGTIFYFANYRINSVVTDLPQSTGQAAVSQIIGGSDPPVNAVIEPVDEFYERITKKPFGIYITPQTSPVQPDKFAGYHTGVDIEYGDVSYDVPVRAITDGKVILSKYASGYGGVIVIRHEASAENILALYGHLDPKSMLSARTDVEKGQIIGFLGEDKTEETDGARKHLHFAILEKNEIDIRGYVKTKKELRGWYDPMEFYKTN